MQHDIVPCGIIHLGNVIQCELSRLKNVPFAGFKINLEMDPDPKAKVCLQQCLDLLLTYNLIKHHIVFLMFNQNFA